MIGYFGRFPVERGVAGEAEDGAGAVVVAPVHRFGTPLVAVASCWKHAFGMTPDDARALPGLQDAFGEVLDDGAHLTARGRFRRPKDGRHGQTGAGMIDMHRGKAALVVMRIPERQLSRANGDRF